MIWTLFAGLLLSSMPFSLSFILAVSLSFPAAFWTVLHFDLTTAASVL